MSIKKLWWALAGAVAVGLQEFLADNHMDSTETVTFVGLVLAAFGAWLLPNTPLLEAAKTWVHALVAGTAVLTPLLTGGVTVQEGITVAIAVMTTAGVYRLENEDPDPLAG